MSYSVFPELFIVTVLGSVFFLMASGSGKGKNKNGFRALCIFLLVVYLGALVWMALLERADRGSRVLILTPLRSVITVLKSYNTFDVFKQIIDNILVLIPFGMLLPAATGKIPSGKTFWLTSLYGLIASLSIEVLQYAFSLGYSEFDDLIFNTLGTMIGAGVYAMSGKAEYKNGSLNLKKGWLIYISPAFLVSSAVFAAWIYREYILYRK